MNMQLLITFVVLNATNVIIQTIKSLVTIKGSKIAAALTNAIAYALYTVVVVYMVCELPLLWKATIIGLCNFIGVYVVKLIEEKMRKDKLWKIEATIPIRYVQNVEIDMRNIPHSFITINSKYTLFNFYCATQEQSSQVYHGLKTYGAKFFATESKTLS